MSCRLRVAGPEVVVFLHGLGASKNSFEPGFSRKRLARFTMLSLDLPGFGDSPPGKDFTYEMKDMALLVEKTLQRLQGRRFHVVGHSMGGVVGLFLAERLKDRLAGFINLEGNLGKEDCFFSRKISSLPLEAFERLGARVFQSTVGRLAEQDPSPGIAGYERDIKRADPRALYLSARSLVRESETGSLKERFLSLPAGKAYVWGEKNAKAWRVSSLEKNNIPCRVIPDSGHFMMDDRPDLFWPILADLISRHAATG